MKLSCCQMHSQLSKSSSWDLFGSYASIETVFVEQSCAQSVLLIQPLHFCHHSVTTSRKVHMKQGFGIVSNLSQLAPCYSPTSIAHIFSSTVDQILSNVFSFSSWLWDIFYDCWVSPKVVQTPQHFSNQRSQRVNVASERARNSSFFVALSWNCCSVYHRYLDFVSDLRDEILLWERSYQTTFFQPFTWWLSFRIGPLTYLLEKGLVSWYRLWGYCLNDL